MSNYLGIPLRLKMRYSLAVPHSMVRSVAPSSLRNTPANNSYANEERNKQ